MLDPFKTLLLFTFAILSHEASAQNQPATCNVQQPSTCWTIESTESTQPGPWLRYSEEGTRFYRHPNGVIFRVYPPGLKPSAIPAHPEILRLTTQNLRDLGSSEEGL